jgi:hypothetical protein
MWSLAKDVAPDRRPKDSLASMLDGKIFCTMALVDGRPSSSSQDRLRNKLQHPGPPALTWNRPALFEPILTPCSYEPNALTTAPLR